MREPASRLAMRNRFIGSPEKLRVHTPVGKAWRPGVGRFAVTAGAGKNSTRYSAVHKKAFAGRVIVMAHGPGAHSAHRAIWPSATDLGKAASQTGEIPCKSPAPDL